MLCHSAFKCVSYLSCLTFFAPFFLSFRLPQLTAAIDLVSEISRQLNERKAEAVAEITCTFEELERALHQRKTALITDLENICSAKQKVSYITHVQFSFFLTHICRFAVICHQTSLVTCPQVLSTQLVR